jgi:hypothetical protein
MVMVPSLEMSLWVFVWDERDLHACVLDMILFLFLLGSVGVLLLGYGFVSLPDSCFLVAKVNYSTIDCISKTSQISNYGVLHLHRVGSFRLALAPCIVRGPVYTTTDTQQQQR